MQTTTGNSPVQGLGHIKLRGQARAAGVIKSCELLYRYGEWHVSVTLECADADLARHRTEHHAFAADWGVSRLLTIVRTNGAHLEEREDVDNPRFYRESAELLVALDRAVSTKRRGSKNWRKAGAVRGAFKSRLARRRHDHQHQLSARIAKRCSVFATEALSIKNMTGSAAGTVDEPGTNVAQKSGLNREILDTAPAALFQKIAYKVPETGGLFLEAPTRKLKPSQTCPSCGTVAKKLLAQRWHCCAACGHEEDRDSASARVVLRWALGTLASNDALVSNRIRGQELPEAA